jgi:hypothetical protein
MVTASSRFTPAGQQVSNYSEHVTATVLAASDGLDCALTIAEHGNRRGRMHGAVACSAAFETLRKQAQTGLSWFVDCFPFVKVVGPLWPAKLVHSLFPVTTVVQPRRPPHFTRKGNGYQKGSLWSFRGLRTAALKFSNAGRGLRSVSSMEGLSKRGCACWFSNTMSGWMALPSGPSVASHLVILTTLHRSLWSFRCQRTAALRFSNAGFWVEVHLSPESAIKKVARLLDRITMSGWMALLSGPFVASHLVILNNLASLLVEFSWLRTAALGLAIMHTAGFWFKVRLSRGSAIRKVVRFFDLSTMSGWMPLPSGPFVASHLVILTTLHPRGVSWLQNSGS